MLHHPSVGAVAGALSQQVDESLERALRGADSLDRGDLRLHRQDRLDLKRRAQPRLRAADPTPATQVVERVDCEPHLQLLARATGPVADRLSVAAEAGRGGGRHHHQALAAAGGL